MNTKEYFISKICEIQSTTNSYEFRKDYFENLKKEIDMFKVEIPIIGGFSSGKSSLVNALDNSCQCFKICRMIADVW